MAFFQNVNIQDNNVVEEDIVEEQVDYIEEDNIEPQQNNDNQSQRLASLPELGLVPDLVIAEAVEVLITMFQCKFCSKRFDSIDKVKGHYLKRHFGNNSNLYALKTNDTNTKNPDMNSSESIDKSDDKTTPTKSNPNMNLELLAGSLHIKMIPNNDGAKRVRGRPKKEGENKVRAKEPPRNYKCPFDGCGYIAKYRSNLWDHKKIHTGERPYGCSWPGCSSKFSQAQQLKLHMRCHTGERPFACEWPGCTMKFSQKPGLKAHMRVHTGEKPFVCDYPGCQWSFRLKGALTDHKRAVHENLKSFLCDWPGCSKKFLQSCHLRKHMMSHVDDKPYKCDWPGCEYRAIAMSYINNHRRTHTGEKNFVCDFKDCGKKFTKTSHLHRHHQRFHAKQEADTDNSYQVYQMISNEENVQTSIAYH